MITSQTPTEDSQIMLEALKEAVKKTLDKKRRLGQYAVVWSDDRAVLIGHESMGGKSKS